MLCAGECRGSAVLLHGIADMCLVQLYKQQALVGQSSICGKTQVHVHPYYNANCCQNAASGAPWCDLVPALRSLLDPTQDIQETVHAAGGSHLSTIGGTATETKGYTATATG